MTYKVFYIDPMSYSNLAVYDYGLLNNNEKYEITFWGNIKYDFQSINGVDSKLIFRYSDKNGFSKVISYLLSYFRILTSVFLKKPALIHIQWIKIPLFDIFFNQFVKIISPNTKMIFTSHNIFPHNHSSFDKKLYSAYYQKVDSIITHSFNTKKELIELMNLDEKKIHVIYHGLLNFEIDQLHVNEKIKYFKNNYCLKDKIVFSCLGLQSPYKGTDLVVKYFSNEMPDNVFLIIAGKNDNINFDSIRGKKNIAIIERFLTEVEFFALLKITDVILLPYRDISQSGVLLTAINEQIPVIVSDAGGLSEPLDLGKIGWCFRKNNVIEFYEILDDLIDNPNLIADIKSNHDEWETVKKAYSWNDIKIKMFNLYEVLINQK
jgi:D-inositol-3-phosphate glycosyltransferase